MGNTVIWNPISYYLWQETNINQESVVLLIKVVVMASRCRKTANVLISDILREVLFVIGAHMWLIFSSRIYVFLISSLPFDCIWLTSLHPTEEEDLEASRYDREMAQLYWALMFSQQSRYRQHAKPQREVGGTGRMLLDEKDERTAIILIIYGEGAAMLPIIAEWSMKSVI